MAGKAGNVFNKMALGNHFPTLMKYSAFLLRIFTLAMALLFAGGFRAQAYLVSAVPPNNSSGAPTNGPYIFVFDLAVNTNGVLVQFVNIFTLATLPVSASWSLDQRILTCVPNPPFRTNTDLMWRVVGQDLMGQPVLVGGNYTTGTNGTTAVTNPAPVFILGKSSHYRQEAPELPALEANAPLAFTAQAVFATNFPATNVAVTVSNTVVDLPNHSPGTFSFTTNQSDPEIYAAEFPAGPYSFYASGPNTNYQYAVNYPASLVAPPVQPVLNYLGLQSVNSTQVFLVDWNYNSGTFPDFIQINIGGVLKTPDLGQPGALFGNNHWYFIPANVLQPGTVYDCSLILASAVMIDNGTNASRVFSSSVNHFKLTTTGTPPALVMTNAAYASNQFSVEVIAPAGQSFALESSPSMQTNSWATLLTTNTSNGRLQLTIPPNGPHLFFRVRKL